MTLYQCLLIQLCLGLGTGTGLSQQDHGINAHSSARGEITARSTEAGTLLTAQETAEKWDWSQWTGQDSGNILTLSVQGYLKNTITEDALFQKEHICFLNLH